MASGLVIELLLLLAGDVEANPGPRCGHRNNADSMLGWCICGEKEVNTQSLTAVELRQYMDERLGRKSIQMTNWKQLPPALCELSDLQDLIIHNMQKVPLEQVPQGITRLSKLVRLEIYGPFTNAPVFPISIWMRFIQQLTSLKELDIWGYDLSQCVDDIFTLSNLRELVLWTNNLSSLPSSIDTLTYLKTLNVSYNTSILFPQKLPGNLQELTLDHNELNEIPACVLLLKCLRELDISYNNINMISSSIQSLTSLKVLNLLGNPVTHLPVELSDLPQLKEIKVIPERKLGKSCPLVQPPIELCEQGTPSMLQYLFDLKLAPVKTSRQKIVISGYSGGGKTSLCRTLCSGKPQLANPEERTRILEQIIWQPKPDLMLQINDFGGHNIYKIAQPLFMSPKIIPVHVFDLAKYVVGNKISFDDLIGYWLTNMYARNPNIKISIVGSHLDECSNSECITQDVKKRLREMHELKNEEISRRIKIMEEKQISGNTILLPDCVKEELKVLREELMQSLLTTDVFAVSSKTYDGMDCLRQHIIDVAEQSQVNLPEAWHNFIFDVTDSERRAGRNVYLSWSTIEDIYAARFKENLKVKVKTLFSKQSLVRSRTNKLMFILCYMRDVGDILFYPKSVLSNVVFHDINFLIETMKAIFTHDLHEQLHFLNFNKEFSEPVFNKMKEDVIDKGLFHVNLLRCLWKKRNIQEDCFTTLVNLLKLFDLCYEVSNDDSGDSSNHRLLFPWYMQNDRPKQADFLWSISHRHQLTIDFHFWPKVPVNFWEMSLVIFLRRFDSRFSRSHIWKQGACIQQGSVRNLLENLKTADDCSRPRLRIAVRGDDLDDVWQRLLPIYFDLKKKLDHDWPGAMHEVFQVCPHCVRAGIESATLFPGELLSEDAKEKEIPCNNVGDGYGMIDTNLVCPSRALRLKYRLASEQQGAGQLQLPDVSYPMESSPSLPRAVNHDSGRRICSHPVSRDPVHDNIFALLVAGSDVRSHMSRLFHRDVTTVHSVLTDARIMGLCQENVRLLVPNAERECHRTNIKNIIKAFRSLLELSKNQDNTWIIFYYSGHSDGYRFKLNEAEVVAATHIKHELTKFCNAEEILVILDCCHAARVECLEKGDTMESHVPDLSRTSDASSEPYQKSLGEGSTCGIRQWSSSRANQTSLGKPENSCSVFTEFIISGLCSAQYPCITPDCQHCINFRTRSEADGYIWLAALQTFVYHHVAKLCDIMCQNPKAQQPTMAGESSTDIRFAQYNSDRLFYLFGVEKDDQTYHLRMKDLPNVLEALNAIVLQDLRTNFDITIPADGILTFYNNCEETLTNIESIKQVFLASATSVVTVKF